jgi:hypothetical protein
MESFEFTLVQGNFYNIKSFHGKFLCVEPNGKVVANRDRAGEWERFIIEPLPNNQFAMKTFHGKYVSAQPNGTVEANRSSVGEWETFHFE